VTKEHAMVMDESKRELALFRGLVREMRQAQRVYWNHRDLDTLSVAMVLEQRVDEALISQPVDFFQQSELTPSPPM